MSEQWGAYDTVDKLWIGNDEGPRLFEGKGAENLAKILAQVSDVMVGNDPGRTRAKQWPGGPARLRDEIPTRMSALQAIERIERGTVI